MTLVKFDFSQVMSRGSAAIFFAVFLVIFTLNGGLIMFMLAGLFGIVVAYSVSLVLPTVNTPKSVSSAELFVVITGCSSGIGFHSTLQLATAGFHVVATVRKDEDQKRLMEAAKSSSVQNRVHIVLCDVRSSSALASLMSTVDALVKAKPQRYFVGLINNATFLRMSAFEVLTDAQVQDHIQTNIMGYLTLLRLALPMLRACAATNPALSPRIINISSGSTIFTTPGISLYAGGKAFIDTMSHTVRLELEKVDCPVKIISLQLGAFQTSAQKVAAATQKEQQQQQQQQQITTDNLEKEIETRYEKLNEALQNAYLNQVSYDEDLNKCSDSMIRALTEKYPLNSYWVGNDVTAGPILALLPRVVIDLIIKLAFIR